MTTLRITKRNLDSLPPAKHSGGDRHMDALLRGFGVQVFPSGRKAYFVVYVTRGRRKYMTFASYPPTPPEDARRQAMDLLNGVSKGEDPVEERERDARALRFSDWADTYMTEVSRRKRETRKDKAFLKLAAQRWNGKYLDELTAEDVRRVFESITAKGTPIHANRWLGSIRACLQAAWREDKIETNPAMKVKPNPENPPRDRVLSDEELTRVLVAVDALEDPYVRCAFALLIETGARLSEVLRAEWSHFDLDEGLWRMPRTKAGKVQFLPLAASTIAVLKGLPRKGKYVVAGRDPLRPRTDLKRPWEQVQAAAQIPDVHIHDIRRTFGLHIARRAGLHVASKLLRHSDISVTCRVYAPLGIEELRKAMDARGADIVPLRRKGGGE